MPDTTLDIIHRPLPFPDCTTRLVVESGANIIELLAAANIALDDRALVAINGHIVPKAYWSRVTPRAGCQLMISVMPEGGGGSNKTTRTVLTVVVAVLAAYSGAAAAGAFAKGSFAGALAGGVAAATVSVAGMMAVNAIVPPVDDVRSRDISRPVSIVDGARNDTRPHEAVPVVLGRVRIVPPLAVLPITETYGNQQYLHLLLCAGYGPLIISQVKVGDTLIDDFAAAGAAGEVGYQVHDGQGGVPNFAVIKNDIYESSLSITLNAADSWHERATEPDCTEISADFLFPAGLVRYDDKNRRHPVTVEIELQYAPIGTEDWSVGRSPMALPMRTHTLPGNDIYTGSGDSVGFYPLRVIVGLHAGTGDIVQLQYTYTGGDTPVGRAPAMPSWFVPLADVYRPTLNGSLTITDLRDERLYAATLADFAVTMISITQVRIAAGQLRTNNTLTYATSDPFWHAVRYPVAPGQYRVRCRRVTADATDGLVFDVIQWRTLRTFSNTPSVTLPGISYLEASFRATDRLSGIVDDINCVAQSFILDWRVSSQTWVTRETNNPASLYRWLLQGPANPEPVPDSKINLIDLARWHDDCRAAGYEFNYYVQTEMPLTDILDMVAAAGRARRTWRNGQHTIVQDKVQTKISQHFNASNSRGFRSHKEFKPPLHGVEVTFIDEENDYRQSTVIVYTDGYNVNNATVIKPFRLPGVTRHDLVYKHARFHLASLVLRPELYSFDVDMEYLACPTGSMIRFSHVVMLVGLGDGRIKHVTRDATQQYVVGVMLDAAVPMDHSVNNYALRYRSADGSSHLHSVHTSGGLHYDVMFKTPIPVTPAPGQSYSAPAAGDLFHFGESGKESIELVVQRIEARQDLTARIFAVDHAPAVHASDTGAIPPYNPQITLPVDLRLQIGSPRVDSIRSNETVMSRAQDGSLEERILISFAYESRKSFDQVTYTESRYRRTASGDNWLTKLYQGYQQQIYITKVETGLAYDLEFRYRFYDGRVSEWTSQSNYTVIGDSSPPPAVDSVTIARLPDGNHSVKISYSNRPIDFKEFELSVDAQLTDQGLTALDFVTTAAALKTPGAHVVSVVAIDRSLNVGPPFVVNYARPGVPMISSFTINRLADGNHAIVIVDANRPVDFKHYELTVDGQVVQSGMVTREFVSNADALKLSGPRVVGIVSVDQSGNKSDSFSVDYVRAAVPDVPDPFLVARQSDGTREFRWGYPSPPIDHAGFIIRYKLGVGSYTWAELDVFPGLDALPPGTRLYESNQFAEGEYTFAIKAIDTSGNESVNANMIVSTLGPPRIANVAAQESADTLGWPGIKTDCFINEKNQLEDVGLDTWATVPSTWGSWAAWNANPVGAIQYEHPTIDVGVITDFTPLVSVIAVGTPVIEVAISDDGIAYGPWINPNVQVTARYIKVRVSVTGALPVLSSVQIILSADLEEEFIEDLSTATLTGAYRIGTGDVRLPMNNTPNKIKHVGVALQGVSSGSVRIVDKNISPGPRVQIRDENNVLIDAVIDVRIVYL